MHKTLIIGGCNLDIIGTCQQTPIMYDSNIGNINYSFGGVAFNICQNVSRLLDDIAFISVLGDDYYSQLVIEKLKSQNVNIEYIYQLLNQRMSTYNAILDAEGELILGINDMSILDNLNLDYLVKIDKYIQSFPIVFFDPNLSITAIEYLANLKAIKIVDGVSVTKVKKLKSVLSKIDVLKVNQYEAIELTNIDIKNANDVIKASQILIDSGVKNVIISLGKNGLYYQNQQEQGFCYLEPFKIVNVNGAGDGLVAGLIYGFSQQLSFKETLIYAMSISYLNLMTNQTLNPSLNSDTLLTTYLKIQEELKWKALINI